LGPFTASSVAVVWWAATWWVRGTEPGVDVDVIVVVEES
jgi:hypothetical protein